MNCIGIVNENGFGLFSETSLAEYALMTLKYNENTIIENMSDESFGFEWLIGAYNDFQENEEDLYNEDLFDLKINVLYLSNQIRNIKKKGEEGEYG